MSDLPPLIKPVAPVDPETAHDQNHHSRPKVAITLPVRPSSKSGRLLCSLAKDHMVVPLSGLGYASLMANIPANNRQAAGKLHAKPLHTVPVVGPLIGNSVAIAAETGSWLGKHYMQCVFEFLRSASQGHFYDALQNGEGLTEELANEYERQDSVRWKLIHKDAAQTFTPITVSEFLKLSKEQQDDILFFIENAESVYLSREQRSNFSSALKALQEGNDTRGILVSLQELVTCYNQLTPKEKRKITPADVRAIDSLEKLKALQIVRSALQEIRPEEQLIISYFNKIQSREALESMPEPEIRELERVLATSFNRLNPTLQLRLNDLSVQQIEALSQDDLHIVASLAATKVLECGTAAEKVRFEKLLPTTLHPKEFQAIASALSKYLTKEEKAVLMSAIQTRFSVMHMLPEELDQIILDIEATLQKSTAVSPDKKALAHHLAMLKSYQNNMHEKVLLPNEVELGISINQFLEELPDGKQLFSSLFPHAKVDSLFIEPHLVPEEALIHIEKLFPEELEEALSKLQTAVTTNAAIDALPLSSWFQKDALFETNFIIYQVSRCNVHVASVLRSALKEFETLSLLLLQKAQNRPSLLFLTEEVFMQGVTPLLTRLLSATAQFEACYQKNHTKLQKIALFASYTPVFPFIVQRVMPHLMFHKGKELPSFLKQEYILIQQKIQQVQKKINQITGKSSATKELITIQLLKHERLIKEIVAQKAVLASLYEAEKVKPQPHGFKKLELEIAQKETKRALLEEEVQKLRAEELLALDKLAHLNDLQNRWQDEQNWLLGKERTYESQVIESAIKAVIDRASTLLFEAIEAALLQNLKNRSKNPVDFHKACSATFDLLEHAIILSHKNMRWLNLKQKFVIYAETLSTEQEQALRAATAKLQALAEREAPHTQ